MADTPYIYTPKILARLETTISAERLSTYVNAAGGDVERALRLYVWNTDMSAALYGPLQALEVSIRNSFDLELTRRYGAFWFDSPAVPLTPKARSSVQDARQKLNDQRKPQTQGRIVAELSFGFWERLLTNGPKGTYAMHIWRPALYRAFPNTRQPRSQIHVPIEHLRALRNRIAHHEPIFDRHLEQDYLSTLDVLGWICTDTRAWVESQSRVIEVIANKP